MTESAEIRDEKEVNMDSNIMTLNPTELIKWCKTRKKELSISNSVIAEKTGVPIGTIDRILSGNYSEFKYSSIQPVVSFLIGFSNETPVPQNTDSEQEQFYYNTIEGYKLVVENKNHQINTLKANLETMVKEKEYLKKEIDVKNRQLQNYQDLITKMTDTIDNLTKHK